MSDVPETIEGEVEEQLGQALEVAGATPPSPTLFRTDDPLEVIRRATDVANALKEVLRQQRLIARIGNREHVLAEGWTLLGSMLGVYAFVEWTHVVGDHEGWEARAVAKTAAGVEVGAAEAQCLRSEKEWGPSPSKGKMRDDYALRSMAQTRAVSKALRAPLGFIVTMAGFDATPSEEMPADAGEVRQEGPPPVPVPSSWTKLWEAIPKAVDNGVEALGWFKAFVDACAYHQYGKVAKELTPEQRKTWLFQKAAGAYMWLMDQPPNSFEIWDEARVRQAFAAVYDGVLLDIPEADKPKPSEPEMTDQDLAAEKAADAGEYA